MREISVIFNSVTLLTECVDSGRYTAIKIFLVFGSLSCRALFFLHKHCEILFSMQKTELFFLSYAYSADTKPFELQFFQEESATPWFCVCRGIA